MSRRRSVVELFFPTPRSRSTILLIAAVIVLCFGWLTPRAMSSGQKLGPGFGQRYLILGTFRLSTLQRELNEAAAAGYRVLAGWQAPEITGSTSTSTQEIILLEKVTAPPDTYQYLLLEPPRTARTR